MALTNKLTAIGDAIRNKTGSTNLLTLDEMPTAINGIETGGGGGGADLPEEALTIKDDCRYRFFNGKWDWFIENYGDKITTTNITNAQYMFNASKITEIPFELNATSGGVSIDSMFKDCKIYSIPKMNNFKPQETGELFSGCQFLREVPDDIDANWDWSGISHTNSYSCASESMFKDCGSLRYVPMSFFTHCNKMANYNYTYFMNGFQNCYALDELVNLPIPYTANYNNNLFAYTFNGCSRLKRLTFETNGDGTPKVVNWKSQVLELSKLVGYHDNPNVFTDKNSGITASKQVTDLESYEALKDDPDWFTISFLLSRYNKTSAVETINSLPDTSAYLAEKGGTNTIKFKQLQSSAIEGECVSDLTEEEIAVATAKGWTVTFA